MPAVGSRRPALLHRNPDHPDHGELRGGQAWARLVSAASPAGMLFGPGPEPAVEGLPVNGLTRGSLLYQEEELRAPQLQALLSIALEPGELGTRADPSEPPVC